MAKNRFLLISIFIGFFVTIFRVGTPLADAYEPNDGFASASVIATGTIYADLGDGSDNDYYKLTLSSYGYFSITIKCPLSYYCYARLYNSTPSILASGSAPAGSDISLSYSVSNPGEYYIHIYTFDSFWAPQNYNFTSSFLEDRMELNNTSGTATLVEMNTATSSVIYSYSDLDWFRFTSPGTGTVKVSFRTYDYDSYYSQSYYYDIVLYNASASQLATSKVYITSGTRPFTGTLCYGAAAGDSFYFKADPYYHYLDSGSFSFTPELIPDLTEPNNTQATAYQVSTATQYFGSVTCPNMDEDWYKFTVTESTMLLVSFLSQDSSGSYTVSIRNSGGTDLANSTYSANGDLNKKLGYIFSAGTYYIKITKSGGSSSYYSFNIDKPTDPDEPNNTSGTATAASMDTESTDDIQYAQDVDWYRITTSSSGFLNIDFETDDTETSSAYYNLALLDSGLTTVDSKNIYLNTGIAPFTGSLCSWASSGVDMFFFADPTYYTLSTGSYRFTPSMMVNDPKEPNNTWDTAYLITAGTRYEENITCPSDQDWYKVTFSEPVMIALDFDSTDSDGDNFNLYMFDSDMNFVTGGNYYANGNIRGSLGAAINSGTYYIQVSRTGGTGDYGLRVSEITDASEPNNDHGTAYSVTLNTPYNEHINYTEDIDWYSITPGADGFLNVSFQTSDFDQYGYNSRYFLGLYNFALNQVDSRTVYIYENTPPFTDSICLWATSGDTLHLLIDPYYANLATGSYSFTPSLVSDTAEPNGTYEDATSISTSILYSGSIACSADTDWYKISFPTSTAIIMEFNSTDSSGSYSIYMYDSSVDQIAYDNFSANGNLKALFGGSAAEGDNYFKIVKTGGSGSYSFRVSSMTDSTEPNNSAYLAYTVPMGTQTGSTAYSSNDEDWFKFTSTGSGTVKVNFETSDQDQYHSYYAISLYKYAGGSPVTSDSVNIDTETPPFAGSVCSETANGQDFYFRIYPYFNTLATGTYQFTPTLISESSEPNGSAYNAYSIATGTKYFGNITCSADKDWYKISFATTTMITLDFISTDADGFNYNVSIKNSIYTTVINGSFSADGDINTVLGDIVTAGEYYILVEKPSDSGSYNFKLSQVTDPTEINNDILNSTPITTGTTKNGIIQYAEDDDWYTITAGGAGFLKFFFETGDSDTYSSSNYTLNLRKSDTSLATSKTVNINSYYGMPAFHGSVCYPASSTDSFYFEVNPTFYNTATGSYKFSTAIMTDSMEPNNIQEDAWDIATETTYISNILCSGYDTDWYRTSFSTETFFIARLESYDAAYYSMTLYDSFGSQIGSGGSGQDWRAQVCAKSADSVYLNITSGSQGYFSSGTYKFSISELSDDEYEPNDYDYEAFSIEEDNLYTAYVTCSDEDYYGLETEDNGFVEVYVSVPADSQGDLNISIFSGWVSYSETLNPGKSIRISEWVSSNPLIRFTSSSTTAQVKYSFQVKFNQGEMPSPEISFPEQNQIVGNPVSITGTSYVENFARYIIEYGSGASPSSWTMIGAPRDYDVFSGELALWDTTSLTPGSYTIRMRVDDSNGQAASDSVTVTVDNQFPTAEITTPAENSTVSGEISVSGTASDTSNFESFILEYGVGETPQVWIPITKPKTKGITNGLLATWNTAMEDPDNNIMYLAKDITIKHDYTLRLTVRDKAGNVSQKLVFLHVDNSTDPDRLTMGDSETNPQWSPDSAQIVFQGPSFPTVMNADGTMTMPLSGLSLYDWELSKDGKYFLYINGGGVYVTDTSGMGGSLIYKGQSNISNPTWAPDGKKVAFSSGATSNTRIFSISTDGTNLRQLTKGPGWDSEPAWSPDGTKVAFSRNGDIWIVTLATLEEKQLTYHYANDGGPSWTPDGRILFTSERAGNNDAWIMNADGTAQTQVTYHPYSDLDPRISPDSNFLAFSSNRSGSYNIWSMPFIVTMNTSLPAAPSGAPKVSQPSGSIQSDVDWTDTVSPDAYGSFVYKKTGTAGAYTRMSSLYVATSMSDTAVNPGETYCYKCSAVNTANNESVQSAEKCITITEPPTDTTPPGAPLNLIGLARDKQVDLDWDAPVQDSDQRPLLDLEGFNIYQSPNGTTFSKINTSLVPKGTTSYSATGLTNESTYYFRVTAVDDAANESIPALVAAVPSANPDTIPPKPPTSLSAAAGDLSASLSWTAPVQNTDNTPLRDLSGFFIHKSTDNINFTKVSSSAVTGTTYNLTGLTNGTLYYVYVTAQDSYANESAPSNTAQVTPAAPAIPYPPTAFSATAGNTAVYLSWLNPTLSNFQAVVIRRKSGATPNYPVSATDGDAVYDGTAQSFADQGLTNGTTYYYSIFTRNTLGAYSEDSAETHASAQPSEWKLDLVEGWNLVSAPKTIVTPLPAEITTIEGLQVFELVNGNSYRDNGDASFQGFAPGRSLWVWMDSPLGTTVAGADVTTTPFPINLAAGWNQVANPFQDVVTWSDAAVKFSIGGGADLTFSQAGACTTGEIYEFNATNGSYIKKIPNYGDLMLPYKGYFIQAKTACTLKISK